LSKFRIYRADSTDPRLTGRQNKKLYMAYVFLCFLIMLTLNIHITSEDKKTNLIFYAFIGILILITIWLVIEMKRQSKAISKIGTIEFTRSSVTKRIGDLTSRCSYDNIMKIEIEKHLRAMSVSESKSGSLTHILRIIHRDMTEENFIVSDRSIDFGQKISILETLKAVKNTTGLNYLIKSN
jgi:hypothetical protein